MVKTSEEVALTDAGRLIVKFAFYANKGFSNDPEEMKDTAILYAKECAKVHIDLTIAFLSEDDWDTPFSATIEYYQYLKTIIDTWTPPKN